MPTHFPAPETDALSRQLNSINAPRIARAEAAASVAVAVVVGALLAWAVIVYLMPCTLGPAALCSLAPAIPTRPGMYRRLWNALRTRHVRYLIKLAEHDLRTQQIDYLLAQRDLVELPLQQEFTRQHLAVLQRELASIEQGAA